MGPTCSWPIFLLYCPISFSLHLWLHGKFSTLSGETKRRFEPGRQMVWHEIWLPLQSGELLHNSHFLGQPWRTMMKENSWSGHNLQKCNWLEGEMTRCVIYTCTWLQKQHKCLGSFLLLLSLTSYWFMGDISFINHTQSCLRICLLGNWRNFSSKEDTTGKWQMICRWFFQWKRHEEWMKGWRSH